MPRRQALWRTDAKGSGGFVGVFVIIVLVVEDVVVVPVTTAGVAITGHADLVVDITDDSRFGVEASLIREA
jgi:hypothetical protein